MAALTDDHIDNFAGQRVPGRAGHRDVRFGNKPGAVPVTEGSRFRSLFPLTARVLFHPGVVALATVVSAAIASAFSLHYAASLVLLGMVAVFVGWERRFLDALLMTPNVLAARSTLMGGVLGCAYMASGMTEGDSPSLLAVQASMAYWLAVSSLTNRIFLMNVPGIQMPWASSRFNAECLRPLSIVAITILTLELTRQLVGIATGGLDRGVYGDEAARQAFGVWTYFSIFPRLTSTSMFLAPVIWRVGRAPLKVVALAMVGLLLVIGLSTGSRGLFLTPMLYLFVGIYFFIPLRRIPLEAIATSVAIFVFIPLVLVMATHRSSQEFRQTPGWEVAERVRGFARAATQPGSPLDEQTTAQRNRFNFGVQMLGVADRIVYEKTPSEVPYARFENFDRILYVWIPKFFMRDKPYLQDGNDIVVGYTGVFFARSAATISLLADLFRRFSFPGILIGAPLAALISALFTRWVFRVMLFRDAALGIVLLQLLLSAFHIELWGTVLGSSFDWLYAIPKHLIFVFLLVFGVRILTGSYTTRGLLAYSQPVRMAE
jgi:hypothetical protein